LDKEKQCDVFKGGVLVVLGNESLNAIQVQVNNLLRLFGIQFNADSKNRVVNDKLIWPMLIPQLTISFLKNKKNYTSKN